MHRFFEVDIPKLFQEFHGRPLTNEAGQVQLPPRGAETTGTRKLYREVAARWVLWYEHRAIFKHNKTLGPHTSHASIKLAPHIIHCLTLSFFI